MAILFFNKNDGKVTIIYYPKKSVELVKELEMNGFEKVLEFNGKFKDVVYSTYYCEEHKIYEIVYYVWSRDSPVSFWAVRKLNLIETLANCNYNRLILSIDNKLLSYIPFKDKDLLLLAKKFKELNEIQTFILLLKHSRKKEIKQMIQKIKEMAYNNDENLCNYINEIKIKLLKMEL
jgi:hypothetical protein